MVLLVSVSTWPLGGSALDVASQTLSLSGVPQGAADDGRSVLLRCRLLHPQEDVPVSAEGRAGLQCLLHQAPRQLSRYASCVIFILIKIIPVKPVSKYISTNHFNIDFCLELKLVAIKYVK